MTYRKKVNLPPSLIGWWKAQRHYALIMPNFSGKNSPTMPHGDGIFVWKSAETEWLPKVRP